MASLIAATVMTLSVLEGHSPIASLFKCDIFALVLLSLDLFLLLRVHLICANKYILFTYLLQGDRSIQSLRAWDFEPMPMVQGRASTRSKASGLGDKAP